MYPHHHLADPIRTTLNAGHRAALSLNNPAVGFAAVTFHLRRAVGSAALTAA